MPAHVRAVCKAPRARLLADFAAAARLICVACGSAPAAAIAVRRYAPAGVPVHVAGWSRGYVLGAAEVGSLTLRAALLTAFGE
jgi:hypothetical protein